MTPEQQRIAIAEARDWHFVPEHDDGFGKAVPDQWWNEYNEPVELPLLNDLNAMHEAEKVLQGPQRWDYGAQLAVLVRVEENAFFNEPDNDFPLNDLGHFALANLTAAQRAQAFLRTLGKWIE